MNGTTSAYTKEQERPTRKHDALDVLGKILSELEDLNEHFDEFAKVLLDARFSGKGTDRWSRHR